MTKIGAQYLGGDFTLKELAIGAEAAGFDSVWAGDHVAHYVDGPTALGCLAGATDAITIGTNVLVAPFRPAAVTAKALSTAATIAGPGRVVAGIGVGGDFPAEFTAVGADLHRRGAFIEEMLEVMQLLWSGEEVSFAGRWNNFEGFRLEPAPEPAPRIWIGGRSDAGLRRAVSRGSGYIGYLLTPGGVAKRRARLAELAAEAGGNLAGFELACNIAFMPGPSVEEAAQAAAANGMGLPGLTPEQARSFVVLGDEGSCLERIAEYVKAGLTHVILGCAPGSGSELRRFLEAARDLLPEIRRLKSTDPTEVS